MIGGGDRTPLRDRLVLADGTTGALVAADGTVDWWCPERVDAAPLLWRLLDARGGAVRIGPAGRSSGEQSYLPGTLVARTVLTAAGGAIEVVDLLPRADAPLPATLLRMVTCLRGEVDVEVDVACGRGWRPSTRVEPYEGGVVWDGWALRLDGGRFARTDAGARAVVPLVSGERATVAVRRVGEQVVGDGEALDLLGRTTSHWRRISGSTLYAGPHARAAERSVLVLHGLPSRSATTSLPAPSREDLAVDARHRWVADACSTVHLLRELGHAEGSAAAVEWLAAVLERPFAPAAAADGGEAPELEELDRLDGFRGGPVRTGLAPPDRLDLDALGALATVVEDLHDLRGRALRRLADEATDLGAQRLVPRVRAWAFLDAVAEAAVRRNPLDLDAAGWRAETRASERRIEAELASTELDDPRLLRLAWQAPLPPTHDLVATTVDRVLERRGEGPFVHGDELGSTAASWWAVRALAALDRWEDAHDRADRLVAWAGPAGILPRSVEPATGRFAADLPDATAHLAQLAALQVLAAGPR